MRPRFEAPLLLVAVVTVLGVVSACGEDDAGPTAASGAGAGGRIGGTAGVYKGFVGSGGAVIGDPSEGTGGTGGGTAGGGTGGSSNAPDPIRSDCTGSTEGVGDPVIDDMEDMDIYIRAVDGRTGNNWFTYDDGYGTQDFDAAAIEGGRDGSTYAVHSAGSGFTEWGAGIGVAFTWEGALCSYDGTRYRGVTFWARGTGTVRFMLLTPEVIPTERGGRCQPMLEVCDDVHGMDLTLTADWQQFSVLYDDAEQAGWGTPKPFYPAELVSLQWQTPAGEEWDYWVDDVAFITTSDGSAGAPGAAGAAGASP